MTRAQADRIARLLDQLAAIKQELSTCRRRLALVERRHQAALTHTRAVIEALRQAEVENAALRTALGRRKVRR